MRPQKYNEKALFEAVKTYLLKISRTVPLTEQVKTGEKDKYGHVVCCDSPVYNELGEEVFTTEYIVPPTVGGLCVALDISLSTWEGYAKKYPKVADFFNTRRLAYLQEQVVTRKNVRGILFDLENNFGQKEKTEISIAPETTAAIAETMSATEKLKLLKDAAALLPKE